MKKIIFSLTLGLAAMAANAEVAITVTHEPGADFREELKATAKEAGTDIKNVTHLTVICAEGAVITADDVTGPDTKTAENQAMFVRTANYFKNNLEFVDFSQAKFEGDALTTAYEKDADRGMLKGCQALKRVILPEGLIYVSGGSFDSCPKLESVEMPNSVKFIGENAFKGCPNLILSTLPENLIYIGANAFNESTNVDCSVFPEGVTFIGDKAFRNTNVSFTGMPDNVELGTGIFVNCEKITEFTIPKAMWESIPTQTFWVANTVKTPRTFYCRSLTVPKATIDTSAFSGTFGNAADFSNITFYVPYSAEENYKGQTAYKTMNVQTLMFEEEQKVEDLFAFDYQDSGEQNPGFTVKEMIGEEENDVKFDKEGVYTLKITPTYKSQAVYISRIYFAPEAEEEVAEELPTEPDNTNSAPLAPLSDAIAVADTEDLYNAGDDVVTKPVIVSIPIFKGTPQVMIELKNDDITTGVYTIGEDVEAADAEAVYYDLEGRRVNPANALKGIFIVKHGNKVSKIVK